MNGRKRVILIAAVAILGGNETRAVEGKPITANDISGKKICWNDGSWTQYAAGGQLSDEKGGHSKWSVSEPGVIRQGYKDRQVELMPDGQFHMHILIGRLGRNVEYWGTVCN